MNFEYRCLRIGAFVGIILFKVRGIITEVILEEEGTKYMVSYNSRGSHEVDIFRQVELEWDKQDEVSLWVITKESNEHTR